MPLTTRGKNVALDAVLSGTAPAAFADRVGAFDADPGKALTTPFGVNSTDTFTATAHGFANGNLVVLSGLTGGSGLVAGDPYFVIGVTANTFQLARIPGGAAVDLGSDVTAGTVTRLVEITGGSPAYARVVIAWNAAADGTKDDSTNGAVLNIPAGATVDDVGLWHNASGDLIGIDPVTPEVFAGQGTYTVTDLDVDLNA